VKTQDLPKIKSKIASPKFKDSITPPPEIEQVKINQVVIRRKISQEPIESPGLKFDTIKEKTEYKVSVY
jgi:hypothetical protein